jgi:hypothetical protein
MEGDEESRGEGEERIIVRPQPQSSGSETRYSAPTHICHDVYRFWDSEEACASDLDQPLSVEHPQMYGGQCKYRVRWRRHSAPKGVCVRQQCDTVIDNNRVANRRSPSGCLSVRQEFHKHSKALDLEGHQSEP